MVAVTVGEAPLTGEAIIHRAVATRQEIKIILPETPAAIQIIMEDHLAELRIPAALPLLIEMNGERKQR